MLHTIMATPRITRIGLLQEHDNQFVDDDDDVVVVVDGVVVDDDMLLL
jgi:hypothetical protein